MPAAAQAQGPSFNCGARLNATEARICAKLSLTALDRATAATYSWLRGELPPGEQARLKQDQKAWLGQRNACGANDVCIEGEMHEQREALNEWLMPGAPPRGQSFAARSWGGIVRSGLGMNYGKVVSLSEGKRITVLQQTDQYYQDRPWFKISLRDIRDVIGAG